MAALRARTIPLAWRVLSLLDWRRPQPGIGSWMGVYKFFSKNFYVFFLRISMVFV